jgi:hypothetical protein
MALYRSTAGAGVTGAGGNGRKVTEVGGNGSEFSLPRRSLRDLRTQVLESPGLDSISLVALIGS